MSSNMQLKSSYPVPVTQGLMMIPDTDVAESPGPQTRRTTQIITLAMRLQSQPF